MLSPPQSQSHKEAQEEKGIATKRHKKHKMVIDCKASTFLWNFSRRLALNIHFVLLVPFCG
jgi:hypothetical protein